MAELIQGAKITWLIIKIIMEYKFLELLFLAIAGAAGALLKDILEDGGLQLPFIKEGKLMLGFIGALLVGAAAGYCIDGSIITAAMGGYAGKSIIESLLSPKAAAQITNTTSQPPVPEEVKKTIEQTIRDIAKEEGVDPELAVKVAKCESGLNPNARNINKSGSIDRGLYQWNNFYHPEITDAMAYDPYLATQAFCKAIREGHISWWNASKQCWNK